MESSLLGRIPPMFLVGEGAREWGRSKGIGIPETISEGDAVTFCSAVSYFSSSLVCFSLSYI